jgi:hypothetical protein
MTAAKGRDQRDEGQPMAFKNRVAELAAGIGLTCGLALAAHFTESEAPILLTAGASAALIAVGLLCVQAGHSARRPVAPRRSVAPVSTPLMEAVNDMTDEELSGAIAALHSNQVAMAAAGHMAQAQRIAHDKFACLEVARQRRAAAKQQARRQRRLIAAVVTALAAIGFAVGIAGIADSIASAKAQETPEQRYARETAQHNVI